MKNILIGIVLLLMTSSVWAITPQEGATALLNGDTVFFLSQDARSYLQRNKASLPSTPFKTAVLDSGTITVLTQETRVEAGQLVTTRTANIGGNNKSLGSLFLTKAAFRVALKAALQARIDAVLAIVAVDEDHLNSVDEVGDRILAVSTETLDFGENETSLDFNITNTGDLELTWTIASGNQRITVSANSGTTNAETDTITVTVNKNGLPPGTYRPKLTIESDGGDAEIVQTVVVPAPKGS